MGTYKQLTYEQRCQIEALNRSGITQEAIADLLGKSQSCISREISRNSGLRGYRHKQAQSKAEERRRATAKPHKMNAELIDEIEDKLWLKWSPEQISGWLKLNQVTSISHESIYQYVWADKEADGLLRQYFPKSTDFKTVSAKAVKAAVKELNARPRKTLAFRTPADLMQEEMAALAA